jgi:pectate lyase
MMKLVLACVLAVCCISTVFGADGFGVSATGGAGGATVTVTNGADFLTYVETVDTPYIIQVSGTIQLSEADGGRVRIQSNKTLRGIGENPTVIGSLGFKNDCSNVIIERLNISCPEGYTSEEDGVSIKERITHVFVTQCTIYDCWDGLLDIARRSDWVTVSWCKFYFTSPNTNNDRVSLVGNTDSSGDEGTLHVTFHHNWFGDNCMQRIPSVRYGRAHIYNNYYNCPGNIYCVWSRIQAECLIENNYFKDVYDPYVNNRDGAPVAEWGKIGASGNILDNCTGTVHAGDDTVFTPPYAYTLDGGADMPVIVQWRAGADGKDGFPPHWFFGCYGDFDISGLVDMDDLATFVSYWLDENDIADADYDASGRVDNAEFALFANNWYRVPDDVTAPGVPMGLWALGENGQVSMDWDGTNTDPDFAGYNLYRTTTSGSGYVKLNTALLGGSNYTDMAVNNGTMYYYVVRSVDTSENESDNSVQACAQPDSVINLMIQEGAVGFCSVDGKVDLSGEHGGYTGSGYLDTTNATGNGANWKIHVETVGNYTLIWRYANGSTDRPARVMINAAEQIASVNFAATGAWENWSTGTVTVTMIAGDNDIRLEATTDGGLANIDYLRVEGAGIAAVSCQ